jgi:hypothetical protein
MKKRGYAKASIYAVFKERALLETIMREVENVLPGL